MSKQKPNSLKRSSILKHTTEIKELFNKGKRQDYGMFYSISVLKTSEKGELKVFFAAPKRQLRKAVSRNIVKRKMKEAVRTNLSSLRSLCEEKNIKLHLGFIYSKNYIASYSEIEEKIILSLQNVISNFIN